MPQFKRMFLQRVYEKSESDVGASVRGLT